jgi:excinuclease ABC subunit C
MPKLLQKPLPNLPGIYLFKDAAGTVIYIGKAKSLKKRVATYFQQSDKDWKVAALLGEHADVDYILTKNETEALLLEAELIQKYKPKYNVLLKTGQPFVYIVFTREALPIMKMVRNKKEKGTYFGPFLHKGHARGMYQYLMHTFCLNLCNTHIANGCLDYHLGNCAGNCRPDFDATAYLTRLQLAQQVLEKNHTAFKKTVQQQIAAYSFNKEFEKARNLTAYLQNIDTIFATIATRYHESKYAVEEFVAMTPTTYAAADTDTLARTLQEFFDAPHAIHTIDCFDISHFQSHYIVGACIRFTDGKPDKNKFRRFKIKTLETQNDYAALQEITSRRYKDAAQLPDLVLIDGGKGQLSAAQAVIPHAFCASLAKREETVFSGKYPQGIVLDLHTEVGKLLIALRDYAHHFAISYHKLRRHRGS